MLKRKGLFASREYWLGVGATVLLLVIALGYLDLVT
ncbi:hypothetical protein FHT01_002392 [Sphingomonas japonica]|uniref:ABC transporter permease n=1 Tax=Sphingomonas japonica TaxID=511662 RepID=A0ABX0U475_9SPHN|nr:hypothetical protein [Sphingomonas japonica]